MRGLSAASWLLCSCRVWNEGAPPEILKNPIHPRGVWEHFIFNKLQNPKANINPQDNGVLKFLLSGGNAPFETKNLREHSPRISDSLASGFGAPLLGSSVFGNSFNMATWMRTQVRSVLRRPSLDWEPPPDWLLLSPSVSLNPNWISKHSMIPQAEFLQHESLNASLRLRFDVGYVVLMSSSRCVFAVPVVIYCRGCIDRGMQGLSNPWWFLLVYFPRVAKHRACAARMKLPPPIDNKKSTLAAHVWLNKASTHFLSCRNKANIPLYSMVISACRMNSSESIPLPLGGTRKRSGSFI